MKIIISILFVIILVEFTHASSSRLQCLSTPIWALQDDTESIDLSPAFITRFIGSGLLFDVNYTIVDQTVSNDVQYSNSQYLWFRRDNINTINCRLAYLSMLSTFGYGIILTPNIAFGDRNDVYIPSGSPNIKDKYIANDFQLNPFELSLLFGYKISDTISLGIKPNIKYNYKSSSLSELSNDILIYSTTNITTNYSLGGDIGINVNINDMLFGLIGNITVTPLQDLYQSLNINTIIIGEIGSFKGIVILQYSSDTIIVSGYFEPTFGISYHSYIFNSILTVFGAYYNFNIITGNSINCFAGLEDRFNEYFTGRFGLSFTPYAWNFTTSTNVYNGLYNGTNSTSSCTILGNWKLTAGFSIYPLKYLTLDFLWSIDPAYKNGYTNNISQMQDLSIGQNAVDATFGFGLDISMSITYKI